MNDFHMGYMQGFKDACLQEQSDSVEQGNVSEKLGEPNWKVIAEERAIEISKMTSNKYPFVHIRMDVGEAEKEGALKDKLIELGWTPPNSEKQEQRSVSEHTGDPDKEVLGFNGWGFPIEHPPKPTPATKEQIREALVFNLPLYTTPQQRKPLTDEQINDVLDSMKLLVPSRIARAIEAAHGIKE